jgi:hypothetical protein
LMGLQFTNRVLQLVNGRIFVCQFTGKIVCHSVTIKVVVSTRASVACKLHLHNYPKNQRTRILSVLTKYSGWLESADNDAPLESLQATPIPPFDLYPRLALRTGLLAGNDPNH